MLESTGPTNTRKYTVAVYFRGERLDKGVGRTIQQAEMNAAANALEHKSGMSLTYLLSYLYSPYPNWCLKPLSYFCHFARSLAVFSADL